MNVSINDIKEIETELSITLTDVQRNTILNEYNTIIGDRAEGWDELIKHLIVKQTTIQILKDKNKQYDNKNINTNVDCNQPSMQSTQIKKDSMNEIKGIPLSVAILLITKMVKTSKVNVTIPYINLHTNIQDKLQISISIKGISK